MPLYGVTHDARTGEPVTKLARTLKVGIGFPKGPAIHTYINGAGKWVVEWWDFAEGSKPKVARKEFDKRADAEVFYRTERPKVGESKYPRRLEYFTFLRIGKDGDFVHDFDAIEAHGPYPRRVKVVFTERQPLTQNFEMWTAAALQCSGDGINAQRRNSMAKTEAEKKLAHEAERAGNQFFPIIGGCASTGCEYAKTKCKPHSRLLFQLRSSVRLGTTCSYDSTGYRSAVWLFSSLHEIRRITGRGNPDDGEVVGIPLDLVLQSYRATHNGKPSNQMGATVEMASDDAIRMMRQLQATADEYRSLMSATIAQLGPASEEYLNEEASAKTMEAEFYPVDGGLDFEPEDAPAAERPTVRRLSQQEQPQ